MSAARFEHAKQVPSVDYPDGTMLNLTSTARIAGQETKNKDSEAHQKKHSAKGKQLRLDLAFIC
jgi:hypothetical protein